MSRIFLSHSSRDNFEAVALGDWLASVGWDDVFLDFNPERGIAAGECWERALHAAATRCQAVVFLVCELLKSDCASRNTRSRAGSTRSGSHRRHANRARRFRPTAGADTASQDGTAQVWDTATGQTIAVLKGHDRGVFGAVFSPDGARLVTGAGLGLGSVLSRDRLARVWDAATGQTIAVLKGHELGVSAARFSPDGKRVLTASLDKTARICDISGSPKATSSTSPARGCLATTSPTSRATTGRRTSRRSARATRRCPIRRRQILEVGTAGGVDRRVMSRRRGSSGAQPDTSQGPELRLKSVGRSYRDGNRSIRCR